MKEVKCLKDKATGECYDIKDVIARGKAEEVKTLLNNHIIDYNQLKNIYSAMETYMFKSIGALYITTTNLSPANLYGGKWEKITNRYLRASDGTTPGVTGGSNILTANMLPTHTSDVISRQHVGIIAQEDAGLIETSDGEHYQTIETSIKRGLLPDGSPLTADSPFTKRIQATFKNGSPSAFTPEYFTVHVWRRVS